MESITSSPWQPGWPPGFSLQRELETFEDISNTKNIAGVVVRGRYFDRTDLDTILDLVAQDYIAYETNFTIARIAYLIVVVLLLVGLVWFFVRRVRQRKASQVSS